MSLSKWLQTPGAGSKTHKQISLLRDANYRLPLFELRKRLVILLEPIVSGWLASNEKDVKPSLLRKDCITMAEKDCTGLCSFDSGKCKIHYDKDKFMIFGKIHVVKYYKNKDFLINNYNNCKD